MEQFCIVHLANGWQTGTLISKGGHVLSAGHGLKNAGFAEGGSVTIEFLDGTKVKASILELRHERAEWLDFSILQVEESSRTAVASRGYVKLSLKSSWRGRAAAISGFRSAIPDALTHIDCRVVDLAYLKGPGKYSSLQLSSQVPTDVTGFSGALVRVKGRDLGIALQFGQASDLSAMFAIPIARVARDSQLLLELMDDRSAVLHLEQAFGLTRKRGVDIKRRALVTVPDDSDRTAIYDLIRREWLDFFDGLREGLYSLSWIKPNRSIEFDTYRKSFWNSSAIAGRLTALDLVLSKESVRQPIEDFRVLIDLAAVVGPPFSSNWKETFSYFVRVDCKGEEDRLLGSQSLDLEIEMASRDNMHSAGTILNIIGAIALDIMVFYSFPVLEEAFPTAEARREFSRAKLEFARGKGLHPWGLDLPEDVEYIPMASLVSPKLAQAPNWNALGTLWKEFFDSYLFINVSQTLGELRNGGGVRSGELKAWVEKRTGRLNQINEKALLSSLANSGLKKGEVGAVALLARRPRPRKVAEEVAQRLGRPDYKHVNEIKIFPLKEARHLRSYAPFLQLVFFRYAGS